MEDKFDINRVIETDRLIMMFITEEDKHDLFMNICHDRPVLDYYLANYVEYEKDSPVGRWIRYYTEARLYGFAVRLKSTGETIGFLNQVRVEPYLDLTELGYAFGSRHWGKGYATEALSAAIDFFFGLGYKTVECGFIKENVASGRVMQKCGMHFVREEKDGITHRGRPWDVEYYAISAAPGA